MLNDKLFIHLICVSFLTLVSLTGLTCKSKQKVDNVENLLDARCSTCHFSINIYTVVKNSKQWALTVERMRQINPDLITVEESAQITAYLQKQVSTAKEN